MCIRDRNVLSHISANYIFENKKGLWLGSTTGLYLMNHQGEILEEFKELIDFDINYIHQNTEDEYWLGTKGNGLIRWNHDTRTFLQFSKSEGISHDFLNAIIEDDYGFFWLPTNNGLVRFNPKNFATNIFYQEDGIAHNEFNRFSYLKTKYGEIYLGGLNGITGFDPQDFLYLDSLHTPLVISNLKRLKINEKDYQKIPIVNNQVLDLTMETDDKSLVIDLRLSDYADSFQSTYAYKIEGYNQKWTNLSDNQLTIRANASKLKSNDFAKILYIHRCSESSFFETQSVV